MGDIDSCLDAFKHLPYFKPLYTTILRQQMQYLTEQLSLHAGEESLVLTTNISAGTISSLTSTFGTGFLDHRSELKKQFTQHCAKNKLTYESLKFDSRRSVHTDTMYIQEQPNMAVKRKRLEMEKNQTVKIPNMDDYLKVKDKDRKIKTNKLIQKANISNKDKINTTSHVGNFANIKIENVRDLQPGESTKCDEGGQTSIEETNVCDGGDDSNMYIIKKEPDDVDCFVITRNTKDSQEPELANSVDTVDNGSNNVHGSDTPSSQENFTNEAVTSVTEEKISVNTLNNMTDDVISVRESYISEKEAGSLPEKILTETDNNMHVITVQKSYLSSSDEGSLPGKMSTETGGSDIWIVAGVDNEANLVEMSNLSQNHLSGLNKQTSELSSEIGIDKTFETAINQNFPSTRSGGFLSNINVTQEYQRGAQFIGSQSTPAAQVRRSTDDTKTHYQCYFCPQSFTSHSSQKRHERRHTGETPWACEFCDKRFYRKDDLHVHSLKHVGQKPYMCPICLTGYCKKKLLELHVATHKDLSEAAPPASTSD